MLSRRQLIGTLVAAGLSGLAGCSGSSPDTGSATRNENESAAGDVESGSEQHSLTSEFPRFSRDSIATPGFAAYASVPSVLTAYEETESMAGRALPSVFEEQLAVTSIDLVVGTFDRGFSYVTMADARSAIESALPDEKTTTYGGFDRYDLDNGILGVADEELIYTSDSQFFAISPATLFERLVDATADDANRGPVDDEDAQAVLDAISPRHYLQTVVLFGNRRLDDEEDGGVVGAEAVAFGLSIENETATIEHAASFPKPPDRSTFADQVWSGPIEPANTEISVEDTTAIARSSGSLTASPASTTTASSADQVVEVTGEQWTWTFSLPERGVTMTDQFTLPVGQTLAFEVTSTDVIHALAIPEAGVKADAIPEETKAARGTFAEPGSYRAYCSQLCGKGHSEMRATLNVVPPDEFEAWVAENS